MSYKATLTISGSKSGHSEFDVLSCHFNFRRDMDSRGLITSSLKDGLIYVEIESSESAKFFGYIGTNEQLSGKITFYKPDSDQRLKQIEFKTAYLAQYSESMVASGNVSMTTNITITAQDISLEGESVTWDWKMHGGA
jgi:type VI protein secretion system component Hcp